MLTPASRKAAITIASASPTNGTEGNPGSACMLVTIGPAFTNGRPGGRRTYPFAQVENVDVGTPRNRAASAIVYSGAEKRASRLVPSLLIASHGRTATRTTASRTFGL